MKNPPPNDIAASERRDLLSKLLAVVPETG